MTDHHAEAVVFKCVHRTSVAGMHDRAIIVTSPIRGMGVRSTPMVGGVEERGCDYCRDDQNMHFGHVEQVASDNGHGLLLRCPKCGWLYLDPSDGLSEPRHIDSATAASWFGYSA